MTLEGLKYIARISGCIVCDYSKSYQVILVYGLYKRAKSSKAFCAVDDSGNKMIFIDDSMPEQEQMFALAHELGHIVLKHCDTGIDPNFNYEADANNFAELLLKAVQNYG